MLAFFFSSTFLKNENTNYDKYDKCNMIATNSNIQLTFH